MLGSTQAPRALIAAAIALIAGLLLSGASIASAATVSVVKTPGTPGTDEAPRGTLGTEVLTYTAAPGEDNDVGIANVFGRPEQLQVVERGAPLIAGPGCESQPSPEPEGAAVVICAWEQPGAKYQLCGKLCSRLVTGWQASFEVALGDGTNTFIANSLVATLTAGVAMHVTSGAGDDHIATGGGEDVIDAGAGADLVHAGDGYNKFLTTAAPDGPDSYESTGYARLSYAQRTTPVLLEGGLAGAPGEGDHVVGRMDVVGGSADDRLVAGEGTQLLDGGPGDDRLIGPARVIANVFLRGGPGDDFLRARGEGPEEGSFLYGEAGDDVSRGGPGNDIIRDGRFGGGHDIAYGGGGDDKIGLGRGADRLFGGDGEDVLAGEAGADLLNGGAGPDRLIGGPGRDRVLGGPGADWLFTGRWEYRSAGREFPFPAAPDDGPDLARCGPGEDTAVSNPWDERRGCEIVHLVRPKTAEK